MRAQYSLTALRPSSRIIWRTKQTGVLDGSLGAEATYAMPPKADIPLHRKIVAKGQ